MNSNNSKQVEEFYLPETQEVVDFFNNRGNVADVFNVDKKEIKEAINKARQLFYLFVHQNHLNGKEKSPTGEDNKLRAATIFLQHVIIKNFASNPFTAESNISIGCKQVLALPTDWHFNVFDYLETLIATQIPKIELQTLSKTRGYFSEIIPALVEISGGDKDFFLHKVREYNNLPRLAVEIMEEESRALKEQGNGAYELIDSKIVHKHFKQYFVDNYNKDIPLFFWFNIIVEFDTLIFANEVFGDNELIILLTELRRLEKIYSQIQCEQM